MTGNASTRAVGTEASGRSEPKSPTPMGGASVSEVLAGLEAAECGNRELDALVEVEARTAEAERSGLAREHWAKWRASASGLVGDPHTQYPSRPFTTSLDAALALAERVLPGWGFFLRKDKDGCNCGLVYPEASFVTPGCGSSPTPALALCIAILKARQASNPTAEGV